MGLAAGRLTGGGALGWNSGWDGPGVEVRVLEDGMVML